MKIMMISNTYLPIVGGLEKSIESFASKFREWGHEVLIVVPRLEESEPDAPGILRIPSLRHFRHPDFSLLLPVFTVLSQAVERFEPDVIHAHHPFLMGEMALRLCARYKKPLVFTYHILFEQYAHYVPLPPASGRKFLVELAAGFANLSTRVIAPSESVRGILRAEGVKRPIDVVPTGVDTAAFSANSERGREAVRDRFLIPPGAFVFGYFGRLAPEKNLGFLARAAISFMRRNSGAHFFAAGKGPFEQEMDRLFNEAGMSGRYHFAGVLGGQALVDCYHALDAFAFASTSETQGMVLCEAMAAGVPVIALDGPGVREVVRDFHNGRLVMSGSARDFVSALDWCASLDRTVREGVADAARQTADEFSLNKCARRALGTYEAAIEVCGMEDEGRHEEWHSMMRRLGTEWKIISSIGRATGLALGAIIGREASAHDR